MNLAQLAERASRHKDSMQVSGLKLATLVYRPTHLRHQAIGSSGSLSTSVFTPSAFPAK